MYKKLFLFWGLIGISISGFGQLFSGQSDLYILSNGTQGQTALHSSQLSGRYTANRLNLIVKTPTLGFEASETEQGILQDIFQIQSNPLLVLNFDLTKMDVAAKTIQAEVPVIVSFNSQRFSTTAVMDYSLIEDIFRFDLVLDLELSDLGLNLYSEYAPVFSELISLSVSNAELTRR